jgi:allantoinase
MAEAPARLAGLGAQKGRIVAGADADLVVWDPDAEWTVDAPRLQHRHPVTPYQGRRLTGVVRATFLRGEPVFERDAADGEARFPGTARGRPLARAVANG